MYYTNCQSILSLIWPIISFYLLNLSVIYFSTCPSNLSIKDLHLQSIYQGPGRGVAGLQAVELRRVRTLYACVGEHDTELSFEPNQIITSGKCGTFYGAKHLWELQLFHPSSGHPVSSRLSLDGTKYDKICDLWNFN